MKNIFESVQMKRPRRSAFDLSHEKKLSFDMGDLIPINLQEVVPGDKFKGKTESMIRMAPMIAPVMHRVNVYVHHFFVPYRILWNQWEDFITGGTQGTTSPNMPTINFGSSELEPGKLPDYMGVGTGGGSVNEVSALPFWAYRQIYNDYYRDANYDGTEAPLVTTGSVNANVLKRAWEKDYFTSALPFAQRGPDVNIPIDGQADVNYKTPQITGPNGTASMGLEADANITASTTAAGPGTISELDNIDNVEFNNINSTINELRTSTALQRWLEKQARGGARYIETILSHFGVKSSDKRLQRAEYLGGGKSPVVISEVLNTSNTAEAPQGAMSGHGIATGVSNEYRYDVEEHGVIMSIMSILPRTAYQQGTPRMFWRKDKMDFYWPTFANLGEQEVLNREIYVQNTEADTDTFGYQQRWAEYKYSMDTVHGDFKDTLDFWHMGRIFESKPNLNAQFTFADPTDRIFAVAEGNKIWAQIYNDIQAQRPMPYFSNPSLL
jgi:hypothetical protein